MALPYAEGELYFLRSALKFPDVGFDASDQNRFYDFILVEHVWNDYLSNGKHGSVYPNTTHARSVQVVCDPDEWTTDYLAWDATYVMFGNDVTGKTTSRTARLDNCRNGNDFRDREKGVTPKEVVIGPFLMVEKTVYQVIQQYRGLGFRSLGTLQVNVHDLYLYRGLPRQMRNPDMGLYQAKKDGDEIINLCSDTQVKGKSGDWDGRVPMIKKIDLAAVVSANLGIDLTWATNEPNKWIQNWLITFTGIGLGLIAGPVGVALSIAFAVGVTAITNPDNFISDNVLQLSDNILMPLAASGREAQKFVPPSYIDDGTASRSAAPALGSLTTRKEPRDTGAVSRALREKFEREGLMKPSAYFASRIPQLEVPENPTVPDPEVSTETNNDQSVGDQSVGDTDAP